MVQEMCKIHTDKEVVDACVHCGKRLCIACAASLGGKTYCAECIKTVDAGPSGQIKEVAWEKRSEVGFFKALVDTWTAVLLHPKKFFANMPTKAGIGNPLLFGLICGSAAIIITALMNIFLTASGATPPNIAAGTAMPPRSAMIASYVTLIMLSPILVCAGIFVGSAAYHLMVFILGGREGFRATFRVLSYVNALAVFNIIPVVGPIFVTVYSMVLFTLGFNQAHKMGIVRAAIAAVLPMLVLFIVGFAATFYLAGQGALPAVGAVGPMPTP